MRITALGAALLAAAIVPAYAQQGPRARQYDDAPALERACNAGIAASRRTIAAMSAKSSPAGIFDEWNRLFVQMEDWSNAPILYAAVHPDKAMREAGEACERKFTLLGTEINQNEKLFARVKRAKPIGEKQAKLRRDLLRDFEDGGAALPPDKRKRVKELLDKIEEHRLAFEHNVREDPTRVTFTAAEMEGLPEGWLKVRKPDAAGNYVLGLDQPTFGPFMQNAKSEEARSRYYRARFQRGGSRNLAELEELFRLRKELASLYGQPTFAHYALRRKMAGNPGAVNRFLAEVKAAVTPVQARELEELRAEKSREKGTPLEATRLQLWDVAYYSERVRKARYDIDQEKLRAYFPADKSVDFVLLLVERLYGVRFRESQAPVWHPDVRYFEMSDAASARYLANFYLDLFPREGKRPGAFAAAFRTASKALGRTPSGALVANLDRRGLNHQELEVLLHEFGHVLNLLMSNVDNAAQAFSTIKWDFVEAPSQMFEEWARRPQTLALFNEVCPQCPQLSADEIRRLEEARRFGQANGYARQWLLAAFDMELSTRPRPPLEVWKELESAMPPGHVEGTMFPSSFAHIASGYAAGYYGYMWSRVIARDLLSPFGDDLLDARVAARYRDAILGAGSQQEEAEMVRTFLGREPSSAAFFAEITGK